MFWEIHVHGARDTPFTSIRTVSLTVQLDLITTARPVSPVLLHKDGTGLNVLIDATAEKSGTSPHKHVSAQAVNSGTDMLALSVQTGEHGAPTPNLANAHFFQPGMVLHALSVLVVESTTTLPTNASAQAAKLTMAIFALSTAQLDNSTTKMSKNVFAQEVNTGTETSVFTATVVKHGIQH